MHYEWSDEKDRWLRKERGVGFEDILEAINAGKLLDVSEHPNKKKLRLYDRFSRDMTDLFRVNPDHIPGRYYWSDNNPEQGWPEFQQPMAPDNAPLWAFRQIENLKLLKYFIHWWIDNRQIENGEFGGGLSDDGDLTNLWPGAALMGITPKKISVSVQTEMEPRPLLA